MAYFVQDIAGQNITFHTINKDSGLHILGVLIPWEKTSQNNVSQ
jgi:hypothetical protein